MNPCRAFLAIGVLSATCAIAPVAFADGDPVTGNTLYQAHCFGCHGDPAGNQFFVLHGANRPDVIAAAIQGGVVEMGRVADLQTLTPANLTDIAAYLQLVRSGGGPSPNYQGLWWATGGAESGWGVNFVHQGALVFATWYTYNTSGKAWWLSMLANNTTGTTYTGDILATAGPPFNSVPFPPVTAAPTKVGTGTVTFTDVSNGSFDYTVNGTHQMKAITRFDLGTGPQPTCTYSATTPNFAAATNYQDLWWVANGAESGWGVNFAHQGDSVFATWYTYDVDGTPLWLSALAPRVGTSNVYTGKLFRTSGPRFDAYDTTKVLKSEVGMATLTFADGNHATFDYVTNGSGSLPAASQSKQITRYPFAASGGTLCH